MTKKDDIRLLDDVVGEYVLKCYQLCNYSKSELARKLDITLRTVRNYNRKYDLDAQPRVIIPARRTMQIKRLETFIKHYIAKCYRLCDYNKSELAFRVGMSVRTMRIHCQKHNLDDKKIIKVPRKSRTTKSEYSKDFFCMQPVTKEQRDDWYNRDYF